MGVVEAAGAVRVIQQPPPVAPAQFQPPELPVNQADEGQEPPAPSAAMEMVLVDTAEPAVGPLQPPPVSVEESGQRCELPTAPAGSQ